jgi:uncharacterized protein DUF2169
MDFVNATPYPAALATGSTGDEEMVYMIACKVTYVLDGDGLTPVVGEGAWPVFEEPFAYEGVLLAPEMDVRKRGIDFLIFGKAKALGGRPTTHQTMSVECGKLRYQVSVFGDRVWKKRDDALAPSEPAPFTEMELTNERAYGGTALLEGLPMPNPINPVGRGMYLSAEMAEGQPLPNLELPDAHVQSWQDMPPPACFFKPQGNLLLKFPGENDIDELFRMSIRYGFNQAIPALVADADELGPTLRLRGFSSLGDIVYPMPPRSGPTAHATMGQRRSRFPSKLTSVVALVSERVLIATYLCAFRYLMQPLEKRRVELRWSGDQCVAAVP